jgi:biopolymer transport protein ExbD
MRKFPPIAVLTFLIGLGLYLAWLGYSHDQDYSPLEVSEILLPVTEVRTSGYFPNPWVKYALLAPHKGENSIYDPFSEVPTSDTVVDLDEGNRYGSPIYVTVDDHRRLFLIDVPLGTLSDPSPLSAKLLKLMQCQDRWITRGLAQRYDLADDERCSKTVLIFASRSVTYEDVIKLIGIVRSAGARRIALNIGDLTATAPGDATGVN